jgi:hypothetical protein
MIMQLEAGLASGAGPYANGCANSVWTDLSGNSNSAALTFAVCNAGDGWQGANSTLSPSNLNFNADFSSAVVPDAASVRDLGPMTATLWINRATNQDGAFLYKSDNNGSAGWWFDLTHVTFSGFGFAIVHSGTNIRRYTTVKPPLNTWVHVAASWDGTSSSSGVHVYQNGTEVTYDAADISATGNHTTDAGQPLQIGTGDSGVNNYFVGSIASVIIYPRALTVAEIKTNCQVQQATYGVNTCAP